MYRQHPGGTTPPLQFLGAPVSVRLTNGDMIRGEVFCYDTTGSNTVILKEQKDAERASFRIIKVQHIREINAHGPSPPVIEPWLPSCTPKILESRERAALSQFESKRHTFGVGVTQEAQEIFNFIHKTHPDCCWTRDRRISVMGVTVNPPYGSEDCEGSGRALERIKQIKKYRQRLETDRNRISPTVTQPYPPYGQLPTATAITPLGNTVQAVAGPQQFNSVQAPYAYGDEVSGMTYMAAGTSLMSMGPGGIAPITDGNGVVMLQPTPTSSGGGVFMMVVHGGDERGGQQVLTTAPVSGHPGPFFAPVLLASPHGTTSAAVAGPNTPQVLVSGGGVPQVQAYDASGIPVMCQMNASVLQEDGAPNSALHNNRLIETGRQPISVAAPPPPHVNRPPLSTLNDTPTLSPGATGSNQSFNAGGGQWLGTAASPQMSATSTSKNEKGDPSVTSDSGSHSVSSTPKAVPPVDSNTAGAWHRNVPGGKNVKNHQRRGGRRRES